MNPQKLGDIIIARAQNKEIGLLELEEYMNHISDYVRSSVAIALGCIHTDKAYTLLEKLMEDSEEYVVGDAILSAGNFGDICLPKLEEKYVQGNFQIKTRVINSLSNMQGECAKKVLYKLKSTEENSNLKEILENTCKKLCKNC